MCSGAQGPICALYNGDMAELGNDVEEGVYATVCIDIKTTSVCLHTEIIENAVSTDIMINNRSYTWQDMPSHGV